MKTHCNPLAWSLLALSSLTLVGAELQMVGTAKIDITPEYPVRLGGYGNRRTESEGVTQHVFARSLVIGSDREKPVIIVTVDNCGLSAELRDNVLSGLKNRKIRISNDRLAICSSHTHSAPMTSRMIPNLFGMDIPPAHLETIDRYTQELTGKIVDVIVAALADRRPARISFGIGNVGFAKNRRLPTPTGIANSPNETGPVDHALPVLKVTDKDGTLRAIYASYACHATTLAFNKIHGDWVGCASEALETDHPGCTALIALGCGGDQNPFPRGTYELAQQHGRSFADSVNNLVSGSMQPVTANPKTATRNINIPFAPLPTLEEWRKRSTNSAPAIAYHARKNVARLERAEKLPTSIPYMVQVWKFGPELSMVFLPGEVVIDYALRIKREHGADRIMLQSYSNDVPCYIPSRRVLSEGGYEAGGAMVYYDRPGPLAPEVEDLICNAVARLMRK